MLFTYVGQAAALDQLAAKVMFVKLVVADFVPTLSRVNADFTYASFTGSTPQKCVWGSSANKNCGSVKPMLAQIYVATPGTGIPCTVFGYVIVDGTTGPDTPGTDVLAVHRYDEPVTLTNQNDFVIVNPELDFAGCAA